MALRVTPTHAAAQQIRNEARWWRRFRTRAPNLFRDELRRAFVLVSEYPEAGAVVDEAELAGIRRVLLVETQHYITTALTGAENESTFWQSGALARAIFRHCRPPNFSQQQSRRRTLARA